MSVLNQLKFFYFAAKVGGIMLGERISPPTSGDGFTSAPTMDEFLAGDWLTALLCRDHPGAKVVSVEKGAWSSGTTYRSAFTLTYNDAGQAAKLPTCIFTKSCETFGQRLGSGFSGLPKGEALFYNKIRPQLDIRSPTAYYAAFDEKSYRGIVVQDDLGAVGYSFPAPLKTYVDRGDAEAMVEQLAIYHSQFWNSPQLTHGDLSSLMNTLEFQTLLNERMGFEKMAVTGIGRSESAIPAKLFARRKEIWPAVMHSLKLNQQGPITLVHQDVHLGNWLRDPDGKMGLYDWQCVAKGGWALDYSYAIGCALTVEDRRNWERDLMKLYLEHLKARGVANLPTFEQAWLGYRQQIFHAFVFAAMTIGSGALQPKMQSDEWCLVAINRYTEMMTDLESLDALSE